MTDLPILRFVMKKCSDYISNHHNIPNTVVFPTNDYVKALHELSGPSDHKIDTIERLQIMEDFKGKRLWKFIIISDFFGEIKVGLMI